MWIGVYLVGLLAIGLGLGLYASATDNLICAYAGGLFTGLVIALSQVTK